MLADKHNIPANVTKKAEEIFLINCLISGGQRSAMRGSRGGSGVPSGCGTRDGGGNFEIASSGAGEGACAVLLAGNRPDVHAAINAAMAARAALLLSLFIVPSLLIE